MKRTSILIALSLLVAVSMVSCKNGKKAQPSQEQIEEQKVMLADSVLDIIDELADAYIQVSGQANISSLMLITEEQKSVKPAFLLDPSEAATLISRDQKMNALAVYLLEYFVRIVYDMPLEETEQAIAHLAVEVNYPIELDDLLAKGAPSDKIYNEYIISKERGEIEYFWKFQNAIVSEFYYLIAQNPELYLSNVSEETLQAFAAKLDSFKQACLILAEYDDEMKLICDSMFDMSGDLSSVESAISAFKENAPNLIERRNALLQ